VYKVRYASTPRLRSLARPAGRDAAPSASARVRARLSN